MKFLRRIAFSRWELLIVMICLLVYREESARLAKKPRLITVTLNGQVMSRHWVTNGLDVVTVADPIWTTNGLIYRTVQKTNRLW